MVAHNTPSPVQLIKDRGVTVTVTPYIVPHRDRGRDCDRAARRNPERCLFLGFGPVDGRLMEDGIRQKSSLGLGLLPEEVFDYNDCPSV